MKLDIHGGSPARRVAAACAAAALALLPGTAAHAAGPATGSITGTLTTAHGDPLPGVFVGVTSVTTGAPVYTYDHTAADGTYSLPDLPAGTYKVEFTVSGDHTQWTQWAHRTVLESSAKQYQLAAGEQLVVDEVRFPLGSLALSFVDKAGQPILSFCGEVIGNRFLKDGCTDTGTLTLDELPAGQSAIRIFDPTTQATRGIGMPTVVADTVTAFTSRLR
ncbi:carboxypeptidase-like regulatory domain-containing protein [Actinoplanes sp. RD1]|uniref:carboxypeptidase-like regulatory domain-containing protein n=1 Tax=Actinoplanes sp. RD1 TaxID=3064538 RepID=UPI00274050B3|nr:carboxypeptidase-like regulatory domain-containing protein [Actinoplanes sp. RD1]